MHVQCVRKNYRLNNHDVAVTCVVVPWVDFTCVMFFFKIAVSFHQVDVPQFKHRQSIWKTETNLFCNRQTLASYITNYRTPIFHTLSTYKEIRHVNIRTMNKEKSVTIVHCFYIARHWSKILISKKNSTSLKRMRSANFTQPYKQFDFYI